MLNSDRDRPRGSTRSGRVMVALMRPWISIPVCFLAALVAGVLAWRESRVADVPDLGDPFDLAAWRAETIAPEDDALPEYLAAVGLVRGDLSDFDTDDWGHWDRVSAGNRALLRRNQKALRRWRAGTEKARLQLRSPEHDKDYEPILMLCLPAITQVLKEEADDHPAEAAQWALALMRFGNHLSSSARTDSVREEMICLPLASLFLIRLAPSLSNSELEEILAEYRTNLRRIPAQSEMEKAPYEELMRWLDLEAEAGVAGESTLEAWKTRAKNFLANEPERTRRLIRQGYGNLLDDLDRVPFDLLPRIRGPFHDPTGPRRISAEKLSKELVDDARNTIDSARDFHHDYQLTRTFLDLSDVALASHVHLRRTGDFPRSMDDLVAAGLMEKVPRDRFAESGTPLRFEREGGDFQVWGVGQDYFDDGGLDREFDLEEFDRFEDMLSEGDIVLRVQRHPPARAELPAPDE